MTFVLLFLLGSDSGYANECQRNPHFQLEAVQKVLDTVEESPFMSACQHNDALKNRPKSGFFRRDVIRQDSQGNKTQDFLKKILFKAQKRLQESKYQVQNIETCLYEASARCSELNQWISKELPEYVKTARYHLSLAQSPRDPISWAGHSLKNINEKLTLPGGYKHTAWKPLSQNEIIRAKNDLADYQNQIQKQIAQDPKFKNLDHIEKKKMTGESLLALRYQHYLAYQGSLAELPLLHFLESPDPSHEEIKSALEKAKHFQKEERKFLESFEEEHLNKTVLQPDVLQLMNYSSLVEETLVENPQYCGLATSLLYTQSNRLLGNSLGLAIPAIASSFIAPPLASLTIGAATGGAFAWQSASDFEKAQKASLSHIYGDALKLESENLEALKRQKDFDLITLPIGFGLASVVTNKFIVRSASLRNAQKGFKSYSSK